METEKFAITALCLRESIFLVDDICINQKWSNKFDKRYLQKWSLARMVEYLNWDQLKRSYTRTETAKAWKWWNLLEMNK